MYLRYDLPIIMHDLCLVLGWSITYHNNNIHRMSNQTVMNAVLEIYISTTTYKVSITRQ